MLPQFDTAGLARTTRKTMERLAPFSQMRLLSYVSVLFKLIFRSAHRLPSSTRSSSDSEAPPSGAAMITAKITSKILAYIQLLDSSMLAGQIAFHLASEGLVLSTSHQEQNEWEIDSEGTIERMQAKAEQGLEEAQKVERVMRDVRQEFYKVSSVFHLTVVDD